MTSQRNKMLGELSNIISIQHHFLLITFIWTCFILSSVSWYLWEKKNHNDQLLLERARSILNISQVLDQWSDDNEVHKNIPDNNSLISKIENQDSNSIAGHFTKKTKTLPVNNSRQIIKDLLQIYNIEENSITIKSYFLNQTLEPWEAKAIWNFQHGKTELFEFVNLNEKRFLRLVKPLVANKVSPLNIPYTNIHPEDIIGYYSIFIPAKSNFTQLTNRKLIVLLIHCIVFIIICAITYHRYKIVILHKKRNDITRSQLKGEQKRLRNLLTLLPAGIIITDRKTRKIINTNSYALSIIGCNEENIIGQSYSKYIEEPNNIKQDDTKKDDTELADTTDLTEAKLITSEGKTKSILKTTIFTRLEGKPVILECFINIDNKKNTEEENLKQEKLRGVLEMAGTVCHEFSQPLQVIIGYCELVENYGWQDFDMDKMFASISRESQRMGTLTQKLASLSEYRPKKYLDSNIVDISESEETYPHQD